MPHLIGAYESNQKKSYAHKVELVKIILSTIPNFNQLKYFTSNEYSIADCAFYTLLSRLPELNITLPPRALCINKYYERICQREAIQTVLELRHEAKNTPSPAFVSNPKLTSESVPEIFPRKLRLRVPKGATSFRRFQILKWTYHLNKYGSHKKRIGFAAGARRPIECRWAFCVNHSDYQVTEVWKYNFSLSRCTFWDPESMLRNSSMVRRA